MAPLKNTAHLKKMAPLKYTAHLFLKNPIFKNNEHLERLLLQAHYRRLYIQKYINKLLSLGDKIIKIVEFIR